MHKMDIFKVFGIHKEKANQGSGISSSGRVEGSPPLPPGRDVNWKTKWTDPPTQPTGGDTGG